VGLAYQTAGGNVVRAQAPTNATPNDLSLYYFNGVTWIKVGGTTDFGLQAVKTRTSYLGLYQLRVSARSSVLNLDTANVFPRVFSPNNDGFNDRVYFVVENPNDAPINGNIYDTNGRHVATLPPPQTSQGIGTTLHWDGKHKNGGRVPAGIYHYKIEGEGRSFTGTVVVAR
jgi:gliding motility-associated-like protein